MLLQSAHLSLKVLRSDTVLRDVDGTSNGSRPALSPDSLSFDI